MRRAALAALALAAGSAFAAGGHHAVDDANLLDPGQCEVETWAARSRGGETLLHAGAGCRVGPVELAAALERARVPGETAHLRSLQLKYAREITPQWRAGIVVAPYRASPGDRGVSVLLLATWVRDRVAAHANIGRDFGRDAATPRAGASVEFAATPQWTAVVERYREQDAHYARLAARYAPSAAWSVDLGRAWALRGPGASQWTLGANFVFDR